MFCYCLGSIRQAWCRRVARYRVTRTYGDVDASQVRYEVKAVMHTEAMYCKQHAQECADMHNQILEEARAWPTLDAVFGRLGSHEQ
jgi:hypothetical protein